MSLLSFLNLDLKKQVVISKNCNFQPGIPQNFTNVAQHEITEHQGVQYTCKPAWEKKKLQQQLKLHTVPLRQKKRSLQVATPPV